ncbi:MAG TPA: GNAT family N-acetyltransferase [Stellaceae bacterium]|jgi:RimJ/RimL family protein N-acetyltransferase|nr:GNAT family N-acetyltransferase [Stellaceae bacterium]
MAVALRTPRLLLREWREEDSEPFAAMSADPGVMEHLLPHPGRVVSDLWIATMRTHYNVHGFAYLAVEIPGEASFIGAVGLDRVPFPAPFTPAVEIGWRLARAYWGMGYAGEAARAVIDDGFGRHGLDEIVAFTVAANRRSWRVMERLGMTHDPADDFDHPRFPEGHRLRRNLLYRIRRARR